MLDRGRAAPPTSAARRSSGDELMRYLERQILLQIIDNRWREHLYEMDYLREGIHLRGFAQIDPLVAYKNEGFTMFRELMNSIWEEFARIIFHVEVNVEPAGLRAGAGGAAQELSYAGGGPEQPSALDEAAAGREWRQGAAAPAPRAAAAVGAATAGGNGSREREPGDRGQVRPREDRPQRPLLVRLRQEVQEVPRRLSGTDA